MRVDGTTVGTIGPGLVVFVGVGPADDVATADGLARRTTNFVDWATYLLGQLRRSIVLTGDPSLVDSAPELR